MTTDPFDPRLVVGARGLLATFNAAGMLAAADVHVARRLARLGGEPDESVLLAAAFAVRAVRGGSVCVALDEVTALAPEEADDGASPVALPWPDRAAWEAAVRGSRLVSVGRDGPPDRPLRWSDGLLYLDRYWRDEELVRAEVRARVGRAPSSDSARVVDPRSIGATAARLFPGERDARQREAAAAAIVHGLTVLTGGPGTGKTTTVARILAALQAEAGPGLRAALVAPTGKAAARLTEAVRAEVSRLAPEDRARVGEPVATTVHRLLGWRPGTSTRFRHDRHHRLPHDVVVVDETSMLSLPLMARLLEALRPQARLLLVGDPDQLASVEAGAVLGDLVAGLSAGVVRLEVVHRHGGAIRDLATAIRANDPDEVLRLLRAGDGLDLVEVAAATPSEAEIAGLRQDATAAGRTLVEAARAGDTRRALQALDAHRLLLAHRRGPFGVGHWAAQVETWVGEASGPVRPGGPWYAGRPLIVTTNDRTTGLFNGDTGVVVADRAAPEGGGLLAAFGDPDHPLLVRPHRLGEVESVYATTVHRAQGSQFDAVTLLLPPVTSPLLTRELLYTAVTRAKSSVRVIGTAAAVRAAVERPIRRASGLREPAGT